MWSQTIVDIFRFEDLSISQPKTECSKTLNRLVKLNMLDLDNNSNVETAARARRFRIVIDITS
jgi:hypothetical protein